MYVGRYQVNYARRQQYRRVSRASAAAAASCATVLLAGALLNAGADSLAGVLVLAALGLGLRARHWLSLARRSGVGARAEHAVQGALAPLQAEGWRLRHSLPWQGRGDIDSVGDRPDRDCRCDRDEDQNVRRAPSGSGA